MAQFDVYENQGEGKNLYPYLWIFRIPYLKDSMSGSWCR